MSIIFIRFAYIFVCVYFAKYVKLFVAFALDDIDTHICKYGNMQN